MILLENMFGLILKDVVCDVVCLFFKDCCVLIIFKIIKGKFNYKINFILVCGNLKVYLFIFLDLDKFFFMLVNERFDV